MMFPKATSRRIRRVRIEPPDLLSFFQTRQANVLVRPLNVPPDAVAVGLFYEPHYCPPSLSLYIESAEFDEVPEGEMIPFFIVQYQSHLFAESECPHCGTAFTSLSCSEVTA